MCIALLHSVYCVVALCVLHCCTLYSVVCTMCIALCCTMCIALLHYVYCIVALCVLCCVASLPLFANLEIKHQ